MKHHILSAIALAAFFVTACDRATKETIENVEPVPASAPGISNVRLERIETVLQEEVDQGIRAGFVAMVAKDGKVVYSTAVGMANREREIPMTEETRFLLGSMTKPIVTVALLQLVEDGTVLLSDPVSKYIPAFADMRVATTETSKPDGSVETEPLVWPITIYHLLTHTSGLAYVTANSNIGARLYAMGGDLEAHVAELTTIPLVRQPGEKFQYSPAIDVAGRIIEIVTGKPLEQYLKERVLGPLEMGNTEFFLDESDFKGLAVVYDADGEGKLKSAASESGLNAANTIPHGWMSAGGSLISTAPDYTRFCMMILNEGELDGKRILSPATVRFMLQRHVAIEDPYIRQKESDAFGVGGYVLEHPSQRGELTAIGEWGWSGYYDTSFFVSPGDELCAVEMAQQIPDINTPISRARNLVRSITYGALE